MEPLDDQRRAVLTRISRTRLAPAVKALAERQRLTLTQLATNVGYDGVNGLLDAINGRSDVPLSRLLLIAAQLDVWSLEELFGATGTTTAIEELRASVRTTKPEKPSSRG
jgi:hypothetical protein